MLAQSIAPAPVQSSAPESTPRPKTDAGPGNAAHTAQAGLPAAPLPPSHEMSGPMASVLLDALPIAEAIECALPWLDNPAVRTWLDQLDATALATLPDIASRIGDAVWPPGTGVEAAATVGGSAILGGTANSTVRLMRADDGGADGSITTEATVGPSTLLGLQSGDAFGRGEDQAAAASGALQVRSVWDMDGMWAAVDLVDFLLDTVPVTDLLTGAVEADSWTGDALGSAEPILLEALPDISVQLAASASVDATVELLADQGILAGVWAAADVALAVSASADVGARVTIGGTGLAELCVFADSQATVAAAAQLGWVAALLTPEEWETLALYAGAGAHAEFHGRLLESGEPDPDHAWLDLSVMVTDGVDTRTEITTIQQPGQLQLLFAGDSQATTPLTEMLAGETAPQIARSIHHALDPAEAEDRIDDATGLASWLFDAVGSTLLPDEITELAIAATMPVSGEALQAAADAGLRVVGGVHAAADALLAARFDQPLPTWASGQRSSLNAGTSVLQPFSDARLVGRIAAGAGGALAVGDGAASGSATASVTVGTVIDHTLSSADFVEAARLLGATA